MAAAVINEIIAVLLANQGFKLAGELDIGVSNNEDVDSKVIE